MNKYLISVILPVYNVEKYLKKCIKSILIQTYRSFELIIVDDGSSDGSGKICDYYKQIDKRIQVIHQKNMGLSYARNIGIDLAKGNYIVFIDSDDYVDSNYLKILYSLIVSNDADIVMCDKITIEENNKVGKNKIITNYREEVISKEETYKRMMQKKGISFSAWAKIYKTSIYKKHKFLVGKFYEDAYIINDVVESAEKIVVTNYNGYYYLRRSNSITSSSMSQKHMDLIDSSMKYKNYMLKNYPLLKDYTIKGFVHANYAIYKKAILNCKFKNEYSYIRKNILFYKSDIFSCNLYSYKDKLQTFLLLFGNNIYKFFYYLHSKFETRTKF